MPFWAYTSIAGIGALAVLYALVCLIKPVGFIKKRWHAVFAVIGVMVVMTALFSIPPARPDGIAAEDWTRRTALCREIDGPLHECLSGSLVRAPEDAIAELERHVQAQQASASGQDTSENVTAPAEGAAASAASDSTAPTEPAVRNVAPPPPPSQWTYINDVDEMRDSAIHHACTRSIDQVRLGFPYGTQHVRLCLRQHPRFGQDVIVRLEENGQFLCMSYEACTIRVRFDDGEVSSYSAVGPSDNSTESIFIQNDERFLRNLRGSSRVIVEAEFYQAGNQQMTFRTDGLEWPRP